MKIILPVEKSPVIISHHSITFHLSAAQAVCPKWRDWISNEFIQVSYAPESLYPYDFVRDDFWFVDQGMFIREHFLFSARIEEIEPVEILGLIIRGIKNGGYIAGDFNSYYVKAKPEYGIVDRKNDYLIYGFDDEKRVFYLLGCTRDSVYSDFEMSFDEYIESIFKRVDGQFNLNIIKYNDEFVAELSVPVIYRQLNDYINSECTAVQRYMPNRLYGIRVWDRLKEGYKTTVGVEWAFDYRRHRAYAEHKYLMLLRAETMRKNGIPVTDEIIKTFAENYDAAKKCFEICCNYNEKSDYSELGVMDSLMTKINESEKVVIVELLKILEKTAQD